MLQNSFSKQPVCNVILYPETLNSLQRTGSNLTAWATLGRRDQPPTDIMASTYVADLQEQGRLPAARIAMTERVSEWLCLCSPSLQCDTVRQVMQC